MNVLFIHESDYLDKVVFEFHNFAEGLAELEHEVYVIDYPSKWNKDTECGFKSITPIRTGTIYGEVYLIRPKFIKIPIISRISAWFSHYKAIERAINDWAIDVIMLYSVPTNGLQALWLANKYHIPVVFRSFDILNQLVKNKILRFITMKLESKVYSKVDSILTITPDMSEYVIKNGASNNKVKLLPLLVDTDKFKPEQKSPSLMKIWGIKDTDKVVLFMGTLFQFCGLDGFINELLVNTNRNPDIKLLIVGGGFQLEYLKNKYKIMSNKIIFTGYQPYEMMPKYINLADVCVCPFEINKTTDAIFPSKVLQYLACGKPVVATPLGGMINTNTDGIWYGYNALDIVNSVIYLLDNPKIANELGKQGLGYIMRINSKGIILKQLEEHLEKVIDDKK